MVDRLSLDGKHVPITDEDFDDESKFIQRDLRKRNSSGSISSEETIDVLNIRGKKLMFEDPNGEEKEGTSSYGSTDQRSSVDSIHSISQLVSKGLRDSPTLSGDCDVSGGNLDSLTCSEETSEMNSISPELHGGSVFSNDMNNLTPKGKHSTTHSDSDSPILSRLDNPSDESNLKATSNLSIDSENESQNNESESTHPETDGEDAATSPRHKCVSDMVRSETEDLMLNLSSDTDGKVINIRDIAADSVKWLSHKLGPVLATKFLSRNLVRMLALCYLGLDQLQFVDCEGAGGLESDRQWVFGKTSRLITGDKNASKILECIGFTIVLYGEQVILIQCLPNIIDMMTQAQRRLTQRWVMHREYCL